MNWIKILDVRDETSWPVSVDPPSIFTAEAQAYWKEWLDSPYNNRLVKSMPHEKAWEMVCFMVFEGISGTGENMVNRVHTSNIPMNRLILNISRARTGFVNRLRNLDLFPLLRYLGSSLTLECETPNRLKFVTLAKFNNRVEKYKIVDLLTKNAFSKISNIYSMPNTPTNTEMTVRVGNSTDVVFEMVLNNDYLPSKIFVPCPNSEIFKEEMIDIYKSTISRFRIPDIPLRVII